MPKKRTRQQKQQAAQRRAQTLFTLSDTPTPEPTKSNPNQAKSTSTATTHSSDIHGAIKKDLLRSAVISSCIFFVLFGFYIYLR